MTTRRDFLKLGALFVPVVAAPTVAYSFLWARPEPFEGFNLFNAKLRRALAAQFQIPEHILFGGNPSPGLVTIETLRLSEQPRAFKERVARVQAGTPPPWPSPYPAERPSVRVE